MIIPRKIGDLIKSNLLKKNAILLTGARQVGKTTLVKQIASELGVKFDFWNCDEPDIRQILNNPTSSFLKNLIGSNELVIIDEAQRVDNIGLTAKLIVDNIPDVKLIITGSSSLDLKSNITEPMTGRKFEMMLLPISYAEMVSASGLINEKRLLEHRLIYGMYPEIISSPGEQEDRLFELVAGYMYKDVLMLNDIRKPDILDRIIKAVALQLGSEVSYNELANTVGVSKDTVSKYIDLLEKSFVLFTFNSYSRNQRNELKKSKKIYFYDTGLRNAIIKNFNPLGLRNDVGALWENYLIVERMKNLNNYGQKPNQYFWRTFQGQEIDYIEDYKGMIKAFEFKWNPKAKTKNKTKFKELYPDSTFDVIHKDNYDDFLL